MSAKREKNWVNIPSLFCQTLAEVVINCSFFAFSFDCFFLFIDFHQEVRESRLSIEWHLLDGRPSLPKRRSKMKKKIFLFSSEIFLKKVLEEGRLFYHSASLCCVFFPSFFLSFFPSFFLSFCFVLSFFLSLFRSLFLSLFRSLFLSVSFFLSLFPFVSASKEQYWMETFIKVSLLCSKVFYLRKRSKVLFGVGASWQSKMPLPSSYVHRKSLITITAYYA